MSTKLSDLIAIWKPRVEVAQETHHAEAVKLTRWHYAIGVPTTLLTAVAGATLLAETDDPTIQIVVGVVGLLAALLVGIQTFYSHAKRAEVHRSTSARLASIRNRLEIAQHYPPEDEAAEEEFMINIQKELEELGEVMPVIPGPGPAVQPEFVE
jgi:hypothetical protein